MRTILGLETARGTLDQQRGYKSTASYPKRGKAMHAPLQAAEGRGKGPFLGTSCSPVM
jgi:hypothetical protein